MKNKLVFVFLLILISGGLHAQTLADVNVIKARLYQLNRVHAQDDNISTDQRIGVLIHDLDASGKWPDINYQDKNAAKWLPSEHWRRLSELANQYRNEKCSYFGKKELKDAILKGIQYWLNETPVASNYWWNAIGVPGMMGGVFILMEKDMDKSLLVKGVELMKVGINSDHYEYYGKATGQNALWLASVHMYASCLTNDIEGLKRVFATVSDEIVITDKEGIQADYSFYQHGKQNYAMGYGKGFTTAAVQYFYLANGTTFSFPPQKIDIIAHYLLDGQQWMSHYNYVEYTAMGREISRQGNNGSSILSALKSMIELDPARKKAYEKFYRRLSDNHEEKSLVGNRYFWRSDLMIHQRQNYYFSLKGTSNRITSGESGNGENIKGFYQGNGTFYLVRDGHEYDEIFPIWNWRKLPGLLCAQKSEPLPLFTWGAGGEGATSFVYGLTDSLYGCFGYDYQKDKVSAKRSWFMFDHEIVNLVSNASGDSLYQSINQCLLKGKVWKDLQKEKGKTSRVYHDSVGYCIRSDEPLVVKNELQTGSWKEINLSASGLPVTKPVFNLGIDLGPKATGKSYAYVILPAISLEQFKTYDLKNHILIIENSNLLQAVYQKDIQQVQAVFYESGKIELPWNKLILQMKQPGLLLLKKTSNKLIIDYCQPSDKKHIEFKLSKGQKLNNKDIEVAPN